VARKKISELKRDNGTTVTYHEVTADDGTVTYEREVKPDPKRTAKILPVNPPAEPKADAK